MRFTWISRGWENVERHCSKDMAPKDCAYFSRNFPARKCGCRSAPAMSSARPRWALSVRFAIEAASQAQAQVIIGQTLASLDKELPLHGEPAIASFGLRPGIWMATAELDVRPVEPDDPGNHCRYVALHFGAGVDWTSCRFAITRTRRWHWRSGTRLREPGGSGVLVHPALRAVKGRFGLRRP